MWRSKTVLGAVDLRTMSRWILFAFAPRRVTLNTYPADVAEISGAEPTEFFVLSARGVEVVHEAAGRT